MHDEPLVSAHPPANAGQLALMRAVSMPTAYYRYLFDQVGRPYKWFSRSLINDAELAEIIHDDQVEVFVLYHDGWPGGYIEIDFRNGGDVEILFIGLTQENIGKGLGRFLLSSAVQRAWAGQDKGPKTTRVHLQTCTLDHPAALPAYQKMGFAPFAQEDVNLDIPDHFFD